MIEEVLKIEPSDNGNGIFVASFACAAVNEDLEEKQKAQERTSRDSLRKSDPALVAATSGKKRRKGKKRKGTSMASA